jgi:hypothetical protein
VFGSRRQAQTVVYRSLLQVGSTKLSCGCLLLRHDCLLLGYTCSLHALLWSGQELPLHFLTENGSAVDTDVYKIKSTCSRWNISVKSGRYDWKSSRVLVREFCGEPVIYHTSQIKSILSTHLRVLNHRQTLVRLYVKTTDVHENDLCVQGRLQLSVSPLECRKLCSAW